MKLPLRWGMIQTFYDTTVMNALAGKQPSRYTTLTNLSGSAMPQDSPIPRFKRRKGDGDSFGGTRFYQ